MIRVVATADEVAAAAAVEVLAANAERVASAASPLRIVLAGGTTPRALYERLATSGLRDRIPWPHVHVFFGDERMVPADHPDSNYRMACDALLDHVPIPASQVHRWPTELSPELAAAGYAETLRSHFGAAPEDRLGPVRFDVILLGLGADGHTASLFPGVEPAFVNPFTQAAYVPAMTGWRLSLTAEVLGRAQRVVFLVSGDSKAEALAATVQGPHDPQHRPAQRIVPVQGQRLFLVDRAAASCLGTASV